MRMSDEEAAEFYRVPENQKPSPAPARRRSQPNLSTHVPVRFRPDVIEKVKVLAERDNKTVSSWIRAVVEDEVERRLVDVPETTARRAAVVIHSFVSEVEAFSGRAPGSRFELASKS